MERRFVYEYTGITFAQQEDLNLAEFMALSRNACIFFLGKSEAGRDYLEKCWISEQTKPDREALKRNFIIRGEQCG